jgi:hypothetical protein
LFGSFSQKRVQNSNCAPLRSRLALLFSPVLILITRARKTANLQKWIGLLFNDSGVQKLDFCVATKKPSKSKQPQKTYEKKREFKQVRAAASGYEKTYPTTYLIAHLPVPVFHQIRNFRGS